MILVILSKNSISKLKTLKNLRFEKLLTDRLLLNSISSKDRENIYQGLSNPAVIKYYGVSYSSLEETDEQMNWYTNLLKSNSGIWWAIRNSDTSEFLGAIGINDLHSEFRRAELGFWLLPEFWGKGFIKEAADRVIGYLFKEIEIHRLEAYVETENKNSCKLLKKLGFQHEGRMVDCEIKNDNYISTDLFALLNSDH